MNSTEWIQQGGLLLVCLLVFASTGLFFCFFLPVGAALFATGVLAASGGFPYSLLTICAVLALSAIAGNCAGYGLGRRAGPSIYRRKDTWYFKQKHLLAAEQFYQKYGGIAISAGLFLPIIRSFSPLMAGIVRVSFVKLLRFSVIGSAVWVLAFAGAGFFIGGRPFLRPYLPWLVGGFIVVVTIPVLVRIIREFRKERM